MVKIVIVQDLNKGDVEGHEFHGNQYTEQGTIKPVQKKYNLRELAGKGVGSFTMEEAARLSGQYVDYYDTNGDKCSDGLMYQTLPKTQEYIIKVPARSFLTNGKPQYEPSKQIRFKAYNHNTDYGALFGDIVRKMDV